MSIDLLLDRINSSRKMKTYASPAGAFLACDIAAEDVCREADKLGLTASVVYVEVDGDPHFIADIEGYAIDLTLRQFYPDSAWPFVEKPGEWTYKLPTASPLESLPVEEQKS